MTSEYWTLLSYSSLFFIFALFLFLLARPSAFRLPLSILPILIIIFASVMLPDFDDERGVPIIRPTSGDLVLKRLPAEHADAVHMELLEAAEAAHAELLEAIDRAELMVVYELGEQKSGLLSRAPPFTQHHAEGQKIGLASIVNKQNEYIGSALILVATDTEKVSDHSLHDLEAELEIQRIEWLLPVDLEAEKLSQAQLQRIREIIETGVYVGMERGQQPEPAAGFGG